VGGKKKKKKKKKRAHTTAKHKLDSTKKKKGGDRGKTSQKKKIPGEGRSPQKPQIGYCPRETTTNAGPGAEKIEHPTLNVSERKKKRQTRWNEKKKHSGGRGGKKNKGGRPIQEKHRGAGPETRGRCPQAGGKMTGDQEKQKRENPGGKVWHQARYAKKTKKHARDLAGKKKEGHTLGGD